MTGRSNYQLSHSQQQIWVGQSLHPQSPLYNMAIAFTIEGELDADRFERAFAHVVSSTGVLRSTFAVTAGEVARIELSEVDADLQIVRCGAGETGEAAAWRYIDEAVRTPFDLSARCFSSALLSCGPSRHIWFLNQHHLIADAWSFTVTYERVIEAYGALESGHDLVLRPEFEYSTLVDHEQERAEGAAYQAAVDYWDNLSVPGSTFYGGGRPSETGTASTRVQRELGPERTRRLQELVEKPEIRTITRDLTVFNVLAAVVTAWMARVSGQNRIGLGFFGHNRATREFKEIAGTFVELFPFVNEVESSDTFVSLIKSTSRQSIESLRRVGNGVSQPRFTRDLNVVFNLINARFADFGSRRVTSEWVHNGHCESAHDVRAQFHDFDGTGDLTAVFDFKDSIFDAQQREFAMDHYFQLVDACLETPESLVASVPLAAAHERDIVRRVVDASGTAAESGPELAVRRIEQIAAQHPDRIACWANDEALTYRQLDRAANDLAGQLCTFERSNGGVVGVSLERSLAFVVAVVAAHKAGAAYLPIDPCDPLDRRTALIDHSAAFAVIVDHATPDADELGIDTLTVDLHAACDDSPEVQVTASQLAYVIGTSGSTGIPKMIQVEQRNLASLLGGLHQQIYLDRSVDAEPLNVAVVAPFGFDPSVQQIFASLTLGQTLHIVPHEARVDGGLLSDFLVQHKIDVCDGTPAHLRMLLDGSVHDLAELSTHFVIGGDVLPKPLAKRFLAHVAGSAIELTNLYGPAECTVDSTLWSVTLDQLDDYHTVPIGRPLPGVRVSVVDEHGNLQPFGVVGELCIGGSGVGRGYLADDDLTSQRFLADPLHSGQRMYLTGDLGRMSVDGVIEFVERTDLMAKVQGYRIELAEVEAALKSYRSKRRMIPLRPAEPTRCQRCLLSDRHPGVELVDGVCSTCRLFDQRQADIAGYFGDIVDFEAAVLAAKSQDAEYDCMLLYSGGKDSSYVLYRLAALGLRVLAFTFDNGHISNAAFANIRRQTERLNVDSVVMAADHMDEIFLQSLNEESTVCGGCFRALTTISSQLAIEKKIGTVVTGLSRGQIFDTKIGPMLAQGITKSSELEDKLRVFRSGYHARQDRTSSLLNIELDVPVLESMYFADWFRYDSATTAEVLAYLQAEDSYWAQPEDTGFCSTNCRMNDVGIAVHSATKGFHNYEQPLSWDIRLGLLAREDGLREVQPPEDKRYVEKVLDNIGYLVREITDAAVKVVEDESGARQLHAFYVANQPLTVDELRAALSRTLPQYMIPARFFRVESIPLTANGKVDRDALHATTERPELVTPYAAPTTKVEETLVAIWSDILGIADIGVRDSFFAIGGDSIMALDVVNRAAEAGLTITPMQVFSATTIAGIAALIEQSDPADVGIEVGTRPGPRPRDIDGKPPPMTVAEQSLLLEQSLRPDDQMFNVAALYTVAGSIDFSRFEAAVQQVVQLHEPLHWTFESSRKSLTPEQAVVCHFEPVREAGPEVDDVIERMQMRRYDLRSGPLVRVLVQPLASGDTLVSLNLHHISVDHGSFDVFWRSIASAYVDGAAPVPDISYSDLEQWQSLEWDRDQVFWSSRPFGAQFSVATGHVENDGYIEHVSELTGSELRAGSGRSVFAVALAGAVAATRPFHTSDEVEVGLVASTRNHELARPLIGYLLNPLPLQFTAGPDRTLEDLANEVTEVTAQALVHRTYPYARIVEDARREGRSTPGGQVFVAISDEPTLSIDDLRVDQRVRFNGNAVTDLTLFVTLRGETVTLGAEYSGPFGSAAATMALALFDQAVTSLLRTPQAEVGSLEIDAGSASVLVGEPLEDRQLVTDLALAAVASGTTSRSDVAVEVGEVHLSWGDLLDRAAVVATHLRAKGVESGDRVIVRVERSVHVPVAMLGVWLAGCSYVPISVSLPEQRVLDNAAAAGSTFEIVTSSASSVLDSSLVIDDDSFDGAKWATSTAGLNDLPQTNDEAYVIFTSGSTGRPNPVAITHGQLAASTNARSQVYNDRPARFAVLSGLGFDSSMVGLAWSLATGATVVMPTEDESRDVDALAQLLATRSLSHALCVPTLYGVLLNRRLDAGWPRHMIVAGEACTNGLVADHYRLVPQSSLTNEYGPTEASIWATAHHCQINERETPIGVPIPGVRVAVIDDADRVMPAGVPGELVIAGSTVAAGYLSDRNHGRFGVDTDVLGVSGSGSSGTSERIFRTGDRAVIRDGTVHFLGRTDEQVNVGGVRVEPGEIEAALTSVPEIDAAAVVAVDVRTVDEMIAQTPADDLALVLAEAASTSDPAHALRMGLSSFGEPDVRLVAHLASAQDLDLGEVRRAMASLVDPLRQPKIYAVHEDLPRTPNGKVDRRAASRLPLPKPGAALSPVSMGAGGWAERIHDLFCDILRVPSVDADESFFDLGGDSLQALNLLNLLEERHGVDLPAAAVHNAPTVRLLAARVDASNQGPGVSSTPTAALAELVADEELVSLALQSNGTQVPIFALHVIGADGDWWQPLVGEMGEDYPFYCLADVRAVVNPQQEYEAAERRSTQEAAARYAAAIRNVVPEGPVNLFGLCQGGLLAYETAHQLVSIGAEVDHVVIVHDAHAPHGNAHPGIFRQLRASKQTRDEGWAAYLVGMLRRGRFWWALQQKTNSVMFATAKLVGLPLVGPLRRLESVEETNADLEAYEFSHFDGRLRIVRGDGPMVASLSGDWSGYASDVDIRVVPGNGADVLLSEEAAGAAQAITDWIYRADRAGDRPSIDLISAVHNRSVDHHLPRLIAEASSTPSLNKLQQIDAVARAMADGLRAEAQRLLARFAEAGVVVQLAPVPTRAVVPLAAVVTGADHLGALSAVLRDEGYHARQFAAGHSDVFLHPDQPWRFMLIPADATDPAPLQSESAGQLGGLLGTPPGLIGPLLRFGGAKPGHLVVDLGCGDARVLIEAVRQFGMRGRGIESDPEVFALAVENVRNAGLTDAIELSLGDAMEAAIADADLVFAFVPPDAARELISHVVPQLESDAQLVVHEVLEVDYPFEPANVDVLVSDPHVPTNDAGVTVAARWTSAASRAGQ